MLATLQRLLHVPALWLGGLAALLYSSWPLAFALNPEVARHSLASQLQAPHQPYGWLFVLLDVLTGALIIAVGLLQLRTRKHSATLFAAVACYAVFGVCVAGAALVPLNCDPQAHAQACGPLLRNPSILAHGSMSLLSVFSLLAGVVLIAKALYQARAGRHMQALCVVIALCWAGFGAASLVQMLLHLHNGIILQDFFISVCSVSVAVTIGAVEYLSTPARWPVPAFEGARSISTDV
jgi:hypothetical protein